MSDGAGVLIREWRRRRHLSQLELASRADVSTRHLSWIETGRSRPTSRMVLRLCDHLEVPLREQNEVLLAAGHAPAYEEHSLSDPPMAEVSAALEAILAAHHPYPALVVDRHWELVSANDAAYALLGGVDPALLEPPVNVIRLSVDPRGLATRIVNLAEWRDHLAARLQREVAATADPVLADLLAEVRASDGATSTNAALSSADRCPVEGQSLPSRGSGGAPSAPLVVPLRWRAEDGTVWSFVSTTTVFGTPREVTVSELAIEAFYPADELTRAALGGVAGQ